MIKFTNANVTRIFIATFFLMIYAQKKVTVHSACYNPDVQKELILKMAVYADHALHHRFVKQYGPHEADEKLKEYLNALLHQAQLLFDRLQPRVKFVIEELEIFRNKLRHVSEKRVKQNMAYYMDMFCHYQKQRNIPKRWYHAILLTGYDLVYGNEDEFSGYSTADSVCRPVSCSIVEASSFKSAYTFAHEIGHALGMKHDNISDGCSPGCCVMSPVIYSGTYDWSSCSKRQMDRYLKTLSCTQYCLDDRRELGVNFLSSELPGQKFTLDDQCRISLGPCYRQYLSNDKDISVQITVCQSLWCTSGENYAKEAHAAIEGSYCGSNKWCNGGRCVDVPREERRQMKIIDGQWTSWNNAVLNGKCGASCSFCLIKGQSRVRRQVRICSNPSPNNGGKQCENGPARGVLCDTDPNVRIFCEAYCSHCLFEADEMSCHGMSSVNYATHKCRRRVLRTTPIPVNLTGAGFQNFNSDWPCVIWCKTAGPGYSAYTFFDPFPDGTYCGKNKACLSGKCMDFVKCSDGSVLLTEDKLSLQQCVHLNTLPENHWGHWSACSVSCGVGYRQRNRPCRTGSCDKNESTTFQWCRAGVSTCPGFNGYYGRSTVKLNKTQEKPEHQQQTNISSNEEDSQNERSHENNEDNPSEDRSLEEIEPTTIVSTLRKSDKKGVWLSWGSWSECSKTCNGGSQTSRRKCSSVEKSSCKGTSIKQRVCNFKNC